MTEPVGLRLRGRRGSRPTGAPMMTEPMSAPSGLLEEMRHSVAVEDLSNVVDLGIFWLYELFPAQTDEALWDVRDPR